MFVILRGSVNVIQRQKSSLGYDENLHINVLTDGMQLGEMAVDTEQRKKFMAEKVKHCLLYTSDAADE